jgi:phosphoribosyl-ATP pyrophosphohydrolase
MGKQRRCLEKVEEEMAELQEAVECNNQLHIEEEFGDVLFSLINYARFLKVDAEGVLEKTNQKFMYRFIEMEKIATAQGKSFVDMSLTEMDAIWNEVKKQKNKLIYTIKQTILKHGYLLLIAIWLYTISLIVTQYTTNSFSLKKTQSF